MIVIDTSAILALAEDQPQAEDCRHFLAHGYVVLISTGTLAEALTVAAQRGIREEVVRILDNMPVQIVPLLAEHAAKVADAHLRWGRGVDPDGLNFGDCFAYALAKDCDCPLLYVGETFRKTGIRSALD